MKASTKLRIRSQGVLIEDSDTIQTDLTGKPVEGQYTFEAFK